VVETIDRIRWVFMADICPIRSVRLGVRFIGTTWCEL
jgi:hypothetical protein